MPKFNLDDYVMVEDRIHAFRKKYPNGAITCELVAHSEDLTSVIIKSEVFDEEGKLLGSDLAQEQQGKNGFANEYSWVENAATSSIGRSLFNAGFAKKNEKKPSRQEMQKVATNEAAAKEPTRVSDASPVEETNEILDASPKKKQVKQETGKSPSKKENPSIEDMMKAATKGLTNEQIEGGTEHAEGYAKFSSYPQDKTTYTEEQKNKYILEFRKIATAIPEGPVDGLEGAENILGGVVSNIEDKNTVREDLSCPHCKGRVFDNRQDKFSDTSPDFKCAAKGPDECSGHNGKFAKGWWINNPESIPKEWGVV